MKYFDRTFFKFTFGFLCVIVASTLVMYMTAIYSGDDQVGGMPPSVSP